MSVFVTGRAVDKLERPGDYRTSPDENGDWWVALPVCDPAGVAAASVLVTIWHPVVVDGRLTLTPSILTQHSLGGTSHVFLRDGTWEVLDDTTLPVWPEGAGQ